jgi:hypothetical protein
MACCTHEERRAELVFQGADLAADGGLGEVQFFTGGTKAEQPRNRFEGSKRASNARREPSERGRLGILFMTKDYQSVQDCSLDFEG